MKTVELIASGYEWCCPHCGKINLEIEWSDTVQCMKTWKEKQLRRSRDGCGRKFKAEPPEHVYG